MEESLIRELYAAGINAEYDEHAKKILAQKIILAHILVSTVSEFAEMEPEHVVPLIEGVPEVSMVPVNPGETNSLKENLSNGEKGVMPAISGINTESQIPYEGRVNYDVHFFVWAPGKRGKMKMILDVEAQKNFYPGYPIVTRGAFYTSRMISAQLDTEFKIPNYDDIKKVYSIWICMNSSERVGNTITEFGMNKREIVGKSGDMGRYDLLRVIIVGLPKELAGENDGSKLHRLLGTLLSSRLSAKEKGKILSEEFNIPMEPDLERRINIMCNLSEAIVDEAIERGWKEGLEKGIEQGIEQGIEKGIEKGIEQGIEKGLEQGIEKGQEKGLEQGMEQLIANFLHNDNHINLAVKMLGVPEKMVLSVALREGIKVVS